MGVVETSLPFFIFTGNKMNLTAIDICNNALDLIGHGIHIKSFESTESKESDLCRRNYELCLQTVLSQYNFSFARKDEIITADNEVDCVSLPYRHTYSIPDDVLTILYLERINTNGNEKIDTNTLDFNFRQIENEKCIVTNNDAPFVMHYQANTTDVSLFSPMFVSAFQYLLASDLCNALVHGETGVKLSINFLQIGTQKMAFALGQDAQQGANSIMSARPSFIKCRG